MATIRYAGEVFQEAKAPVDDQMIFPNQATQHARGGADLDWQYPFSRGELVKAGLLPVDSTPAAGGEDIHLPRGLSVFEAIQMGLIR